MKLFDVQKEPQGVSMKQVESWSTDLHKWVYITIAVLTVFYLYLHASSCVQKSLCVSLCIFFLTGKDAERLKTDLCKNIGASFHTNFLKDTCNTYCCVFFKNVLEIQQDTKRYIKIIYRNTSRIMTAQNYGLLLH